MASFGENTNVPLVDEFKRDRVAELDLEVVENLAASFQEDVDKEIGIRDDLRAVARKLERGMKAVLHTLQRIHLDAESEEKTSAIGVRAEGLLRTEIAEKIRECGEKVPPNEYYKFADHFRFQVIKSVFATGLSKFLIDGSFATLEYVAEVLKLPTPETRQGGEIFLEWEEYLEGMIDVGQELARLAKNCVILDNVALVEKIHAYMATLTYGFGGLNFRNDGLRRKYDSLKYDSRAIEEVRFDLKMQKEKNKN